MHSRTTFKAALVCLFAFVATTAMARGESEPDLIQGNWEGDWLLDSGGGGKQTAKVIALGQGEYVGSFTAYDGSEQEKETFTFAIRGTTEKDRVSFDTRIPLGEKLGTFEWKAAIKDGAFTGRYTNNREYTGGFTLKRVVKKIPTVGVKPLPGSIVLFDGQKLEGAENSSDWEIIDGALRPKPVEGVVPGKHLVFTQAFKSAQIHIEFRTPFAPSARGADRGQSGVFLHGRYEIQIVDSFGLAAGDDTAGALYLVKSPADSVELPPGEWQALDITYTAPKRKADGTTEKPGELLVMFNDTLILDRIKLDSPTQDAPFADATGQLPALVLENAGQAVEFRNISLVTLD